MLPGEGNPDEFSSRMHCGVLTEAVLLVILGSSARVEFQENLESKLSYVIRRNLANTLWHKVVISYIVAKQKGSCLLFSL